MKHMSVRGDVNYQNMGIIKDNLLVLGTGTLNITGTRIFLVLS